MKTKQCLKRWLCGVICLLLLPVCAVEQTAQLPMKVCVLDFMSLDSIGQKRFLDVNNNPIVIPTQCTLTDADRASINPVMQGCIRLIDAWNSTKTGDANRQAQIDDNSFRRSTALALFQTIVKGEARPMVIGANYLAGYLGHHPEVFACVDPSLVGETMKKLQRDPDFPSNFMDKLMKATGVTHLVYGTVSDLRSKHRAFKGYGVETKTTYYYLDVIIKVVDLAARHTIYSNVYTSEYEDQRPISSALFDNNVFQNLMTSALQDAAEDLYEQFSPQVTAAAPVAVVAPVGGTGGLRPSGARAVSRGRETVTPVAPSRFKLAIAEPLAKGGIAKEDIEAFWSILEASATSDEYTLVSREALTQMMTEIGLTTSSDLLNLNTDQKAKLGKIEAVNYLLVAEIGKFGRSLNCTLRVVESSTGEISQNRRANLRVKNLDELADKIEPALEQLFSDDKKLHAVAILSPAIRIASAPTYLSADFATWMESGLIDAGIQVQNLKSVSKILAENNLADLSELEPKLYTKVGKLLEVENLIQTSITRFEIAQIPYTVAETGASGYRTIGYLEGSVRVISAAKGNVVKSIPFEEAVDFRAYNRSLTRNWIPDDYGKNLIKTVINGQIMPRLVKEVK